MLALPPDVIVGVLSCCDARSVRNFLQSCRPAWALHAREDLCAKWLENHVDSPDVSRLCARIPCTNERAAHLQQALSPQRLWGLTTEAAGGAPSTLPLQPIISWLSLWAAKNARHGTLSYSLALGGAHAEEPVEVSSPPAPRSYTHTMQPASLTGIACGVDPSV